MFLLTLTHVNFFHQLFLSLVSYTMSKEIPEFISQKDCITVPKGSCFDLLVRINDLYAAFAYEDTIKLESPKYDHLKMKTWASNNKMVYFLGVTTQPKDGYIWIINCKCVIDAFVKGKKWPQTLYDNEEWNHCKNEKCDSVSCSKCQEEECTFPHKNKVIYCEYNDAKRRERLEKKIEKDDRSCSKCKTTLRQFNAKHPYCKLMNWTPVPKATNQL